MLNNGSDGLVDQHTRFLMRFDNDFKVDGYPSPNIEDGLEIKGGEFVLVKEIHLPLIFGINH